MENAEKDKTDKKDKVAKGVSADQNNNEIKTFQDELRVKFATYSENFNVVHINAQSIPKHHYALSATFINLHNVDAVLVSETFLKQSMRSMAGYMPGYNLIRNDRAGKGGGGVAIYLRKELEYKLVDKSPSNYNSSAEYIFIEVYDNETKILLGVFYSPNLTIDYFSKLGTLLKEYCPVYEHINILGDFNTDMLKQNRRVAKLRYIIEKFHLHLLPLGPTHFAPHSKASALDLIIVSKPSNVATHGQLASGFSYHDMIYVSNEIKPWRSRPQLNEVLIRQKSEVEAALAVQRKALSVYKRSGRRKSDLEEYKSSRKSIEEAEKKIQRENRKLEKLKE